MTYKPCSKIINAIFSKKKYILLRVLIQVYIRKKNICSKKKKIYILHIHPLISKAI